MSTDSDTWLRLRRGEFSGIDAFQQRRLAVRGNLDHAIAFEGMFRLVGGRRPLVEIHDIPVARHRISTLTMGRGPDVLLLHGLGGTRASLFETAAALSGSYRVHAPDLPGFGSSSKPSLGGYNARWFAEIMFGLMDQLGIARANVVGNSMGGRVAIEMGLTTPERIGALGLLCLRWPGSGEGSIRSSGCSGRNSASSPTRSAARWSRRSSGACSTTAI